MKQACRVKVLSLILAGILLLSGALPVILSAEDADSAMVTDEIVMTPGASIRTAENYGIRFEATVAKNFLDTWGSSAVYGMLIAPVDRISGEFSLESMAAEDCVNVVSQGWSEETEKGKVFRVALTDLPKTYDGTNMKFAARAYAIVSDGNGGTYTMYAAYDRNNNRSLVEVARAYKNMEGYTENDIVESIIDAGTLPTFTYIRSGSTGADYMTVAKDSVTYGDGVTATDGDRVNADTMITANVELKVGMKLEFDLELLANKSGSTSGAYFWLGDPAKDMTDGANAFAILRILENGGALQVGQVGIAGAGALTGVATKPVNGESGTLPENVTKLHISFHIKENNRITVMVIQKNDRNFYSETVTLEVPLTDARLCFGTAGLSYKVGNLTAREVGLFDYVIGSGSDYVNIEADSVTYGSAVTSERGKYINPQTYIMANRSVRVGQKIEFDVNLSSFKTKADGDSLACFWLANDGTDFTRAINSLASVQIYLYGTSELGAFGAEGGAIQFKNLQVVGDGNALCWGIINLHIIYEIVDANTIRVTFSNGRRTRVWTKTITTTAPVTDARLCFGTAGVGFTVENLSISDIG